MNYWLIKSEPDTWSWDMQAKKGAKGEAWTGVRNHTAKLNLAKMKKGDRAFFYHSGEGEEIVLKLLEAWQHDKKNLHKLPSVTTLEGEGPRGKLIHDLDALLLDRNDPAGRMRAQLGR